MTTNNVIPFKRKTEQRQFTIIEVADLKKELQEALTDPSVLNAPEPVHEQQILEDLDTASSAYLEGLLALAQEKERVERDWQRRQANLKMELETAAYSAFISGVPEDEIYSVDEYVARALESAISKVKAQA